VLDFGCGSGALLDVLPLKDYVGVDQDMEALLIAKARHPELHFEPNLPEGERFDTIVGLAVIEHLPDPATTLNALRGCLSPSGRIVFTTPARLADRIHAAGARIGLFSAEAHREHQTIFGRRAMAELARSCGLRVTLARRFLLGLNQLFVLEAIE
jgi:2-polyprenyl-3-methyl-5-hydroxy-6-metoxy-1,4-benzoquinol methylase